MIIFIRWSNFGPLLSFSFYSLCVRTFNTARAHSELAHTFQQQYEKLQSDLDNAKAAEAQLLTIQRRYSDLSEDYTCLQKRFSALQEEYAALQVDSEREAFFADTMLQNCVCLHE